MIESNPINWTSVNFVKITTIFLSILVAVLTLAIYFKNHVFSFIRSYIPEEMRTEIRLVTNFADNISSNRRCDSVAEQLPFQRDGFVLREFLSKKECVSVIRAAEQLGFGVANYDKEYRGNLRLMTIDCGLSDKLWLRLQHYLPDTVVCSLDGSKWRKSGLVDTWKWSKYLSKKGRDSFAPHIDGTFWPKPDRRSFYSLNIYLNDDFLDGRTRFWQSASGEGEPDFECAPETGLALVFRQPPKAKYLHDGEPIRSKTNKIIAIKYLLRCDVMYDQMVDSD